MIEGAIPISDATYPGFQPVEFPSFNLLGAPISLYGAKISTYGVHQQQRCAVHHKLTSPVQCFQRPVSSPTP
jgi:hypothetical protein